jgi:hypothetical protein
VKKSPATIRCQCWVRNSFQVVVRLRSGAGWMPCRSGLNMGGVQVIQGTVTSVDAALGALYPTMVINKVQIKLALHGICSTTTSKFRPVTA